jgi:hypothetical protein
MLKHISEQYQAFDYSTTVNRLRVIHAIVLKALPKSLQPYCDSVYFSNQTLIINITNNAALGKIRQYHDVLRQALEEKNVTPTEIKTVRYFKETPLSPVKTHRMTPAALEAFQQLQESVTDLSLKEAIMHLLASHER